MIYPKFKKFEENEILFKKDDEIYYFKYKKDNSILFYKAVGKNKRKTIKKVKIKELIIELKFYLDNIKNK